MAGHAGITWGKVIAGATIAAGAVILTAAFFPNATAQGTWNSISGGVSDFFNAIGKLFTGTPAPAAPGAEAGVPGAPAAPAAPTEPFFSTGVQKGLLGAAMVGGGFALRSHMKGKEEHLNEQAQIEQADTAAQGGFVEREQMKAMQGIMKARMMMASPEYMAQAGAARTA